MKRLLIALAIAGAIYGIGLSVGGVLAMTDSLPLGATHNECDEFAKTIAEEKGIDEKDVEQSDIKALAEECLAGHVRTESDVLKDFVVWSVWPAAICALIFLIWPLWARTLQNQDAAEGIEHKDS